MKGSENNDGNIFGNKNCTRQLAFKDLPDALKEPVKKELEANGVGFLAE